MKQRRLSFHTSNRLDVLAQHLAARLAAAPLPPWQDEILVVQSQGMRRWLSLALATQHGVCAGTAMPFPQTFVHSLAARLGDGTAPASHDASAFGRGALTWRIFAGMTDWPNDPAFAPAARYLEEDRDGRKRYQLARRLADLFDNYQLFRPDMLLAWEKDPAALPASLVEDHAGTAAWQARLWRRLVESAEEPSLAARMTSLIEKLETDDPDRLAGSLPPRVTVFGVSTLAPVFIRLLSALARSVPVALYFVSPTREYWADIRSRREADRIRERLAAGGGSDEDAHVEEGHSLLASLGAQGRDFFSLLQDADPDGTAWQPLEFVDPAGSGTPASALHTVQSDILDLRGTEPSDEAQAAEDERPALTVNDDSIVVDCCHSPMREMEVLRDRILDAFERDPDLRPDDVLVLVTSIARYAPYIEAVFGVREPGIPLIPFSVADRSPAEDASPIKAVLRLLEVSAGRFEAGDVIDLLELDIVRRRFNVGADDLQLLRGWAELTKIRWGIDAGWRERELGLARMEANSWKSGIDRLLMGYAVGDCDSLVGGIAPAADAAAGDPDLLGSFTAFVETLFSEQRSLRSAAKPAGWAANVRRACDLFLAPAPEDEAALAILRAALDELAVYAERAGLDEEISAAVLRAWLGDALSDDSKGHGFIDGRVTFCALKPMRTIPFKMICVAGLGDRDFPRRDRPAGFDLMAAAPRPGDRSLRSDDRYLFLETILAAQERLVLTYEGRSQTDTNERAPSVVLSELLDHLDARFLHDGSRDGAGASVVVTQAMHPYDSRYFTGTDPRLFSYSAEYCAVSAAAGDTELRAPRPALSVLATTDEPAQLGLSPIDLAEFWVNPSKAYLETALGIVLRERAEEDEDSEPFELDNLERYGLGQRMLGRRLEAGSHEVDAPAKDLQESELAWLQACGELPVGGFGAATYAELARSVDELAARIGDVPARSTEIIELSGPGWRVAGALDGLAEDGQLRYRCAKLKHTDYVRAWVRHVVLNAATEEDGRSGARTLLLYGTDATVFMKPPSRARTILEDLVAGYREGMTRPLPLFPATAFAYAEEILKQAAGSARATPRSLDHALRRAWQGNDFTPGLDRDDAHIALCFRDLDPLETFGDEARALAMRLWLPILESSETR